MSGGFNGAAEGFLGFDPIPVVAMESFEGRQDPITNGKYKAVGIGAERRTTKNNDKAWYWRLEFMLVGSDFDGRTLVIRFNVGNPSATAAEIGQRQMKRYLDCIRNLEPTEERHLLGIPVLLTVVGRMRKFERDGEQKEGIYSEIIRIEPFDEPSKGSPDEAVPF